MRHDIAFLHTSPLHIATFEGLLNELSPQLAARHVVAENLLADAQRLGVGDRSLIQRVQSAMTDAASTGARVVVCTCSTIGGAAERTPTEGKFFATRIDRAMADRAATSGHSVLVVAALESTLTPTIALIQESAAARQTGIKIRSLLVPDAWRHFIAGDQVSYIREIAIAVTDAAAGADVVVLAQASMAPAAEALAGLGIEVLSSPRLGVQRAIECVHSATSIV